MTQKLLQLLFLAAFLLPVCISAQPDTLNRVDSLGRKQGYWKVTGKMAQYVYMHYGADSLVEEGRYVDGKREGSWKFYDEDGSLQKSVNFLHDYEDGPYKVYFRDGNVCEEGIKKQGEFVPEAHILYRRDSTGRITAYRNAYVCGKVSGVKSCRKTGEISISLVRLDEHFYTPAGSAKVDSLGNYIIYDVKPGRYQVNCSGGGIIALKDTVRVLVPNDTVVKNFFVEPDLSHKPAPMMNVNVSLGRRITAELAFGLLRYEDGSHFTYSAHSFQLGSEFSIYHHDLLIGPKFTYSQTFGAVFLGANAGGSLIYYTDFTAGGLYLRPHVGVDVFTFLDANIGWNIPLYNPGHYFRGRVSGFTLTFALTLYNWKRFTH